MKKITKALSLILALAITLCTLPMASVEAANKDISSDIWDLGYSYVYSEKPRCDFYLQNGKAVYTCSDDLIQNFLTYKREHDFSHAKVELTYKVLNIKSPEYKQAVKDKNYPTYQTYDKKTGAYDYSELSKKKFKKLVKAKKVWYITDITITDDPVDYRKGTNNGKNNR